MKLEGSINRPHSRVSIGCNSRTAPAKPNDYSAEQLLALLGTVLHLEGGEPVTLAPGETLY